MTSQSSEEQNLQYFQPDRLTGMAALTVHHEFKALNLTYDCRQVLNM